MLANLFMNNSDTPSRILSYVVASDNGLAPNISGDICTLSVCKPVIRNVSKAGQDLIVGMSTASDHRNKVIYAMHVDEKIPFEEYFDDPRFACKKPGADIKGDNFFKLENGSLRIAFEQASHFGKDKAIARDLKAPFALASSRFWYFGENAPMLPEELVDTKIALPDTHRRGHRVISSSETIESFTSWINNWEQGIHGKLRDFASLGL